MDLNPAQHDAVHTLSGPLLVLAGAGTGKTRVVTYRIAELIRRGVRETRILAVTFTNKAANEMQQRAAALTGRRAKAGPEISTFHSLCVRVLRRHIRRLGYPTTFAIYDRSDQQSVARQALREIRVASAQLRPEELIYLMGRWKMASVGPEQAASIAQTDRQHLAAAAYRRYQNALRAAGAVDFDDLLLCTEELFRRFPEVQRAEADRFDHLLVDEYQDTNASQYRIVKGLAAGHRNLCVVGDDDQSIYGWRGAEVTHILRFKHDWPDAKVVRLEVNYRSTREILDWANRLIAFNRLRHQKVLRATCGGEQPRILQLPDETEEAKGVVAEIAGRIAAKKRRARDFAVLFRTNEQPRALEIELRRAKIPYVLVGGQSFYDRKEVRDVLAYLKLLVNPRDEVSLLRIINVPARGIGQATVRGLLAEAVDRGKPLWDVLGRADKLGGISSGAIEAIEGFRSMIERSRKRAKAASPEAMVTGLIREIGYQEELARLYTDPAEQQSRWAAVEEVVNAAASYSRRAAQPTLGGFLQEAALCGNDDGDKESQLDRDAVALMTLHAAKGLEFSEVYLVGMEEGLLPHRRSIGEKGSAIDEERRLCYVGVTRAKRRLTLTLSLSRRKWGKARATQPSRFLYEITGQADNPSYLKITGKRKLAGAKARRRGSDGTAVGSHGHGRPRTVAKRSSGSK
ncbi:MAG: AAA family ATPase [Planctomycetes bacterium RBG_13_63_9]|nr:MAG: AAA family ATPase [Planctomycetes bacterium RBG_13_63_9]